ncbi:MULTISPECIES: glycosyltransferase family 8 protein [unclassified Paenibacillus]|uniref:glycosyltransferase family 8 protein n=1 Tax=unclassified Paenibacillus TaxID=185978 RepID=UPI0008380FA4|nr:MULTISPECIES: glycosyltransferase family 8 protein [unclassified Paenibacillus]NWL89274.1 glycosyltransferase family 8 protein [Paenibacillus sp. 79R4]
MVELALAFTDKDGSYAEHAAVVLTSVFHNTSSQVNVHILHDESLTRENMLRIKQLVTHHNHTVKFYSVVLDRDLAETVEGAQSVNSWTWGSMYRLLLPSLLDVSKVIYLDCDVLVNLDIQELWDVDLNGCYLAAARDLGAAGLADVLLPLGFNPDTYFNSGVIVFELDNIRQNSEWYVKMQDFLRQHPSTSLPDQDVLNHLYGDNYLQLDGNFNIFIINIPDLDFNHRIVHFAGGAKWWEPVSPGFTLYQEYLNQTPWRLPKSYFAGLLDPMEDNQLLPLEHVGSHHGGHPPRRRHSIERSRMKRMKRSWRLKKSRRLTKLKVLQKSGRRLGLARRHKTLRSYSLRRMHRTASVQPRNRLSPERGGWNSSPARAALPRRRRRVVVPRRGRVARTPWKTVHSRANHRY